MLLYCEGDTCPLRHDCYRHTQPSPGRDRFGELPFNAVTQHCEYFYSNEPMPELIRQTAYFIWQRKGCPVGSAEVDWDEAYQSLCVGMGKDANKKRSSRL